MCATTSVRRNIPIPGKPLAPRKVRGRDEVTFWGLPRNTTAEQKQCDDHVILWIRQMYLTCLIYAFGMGDTASYLEHPGDPANYYTKIPGHDSNPTIWIMKFFLRWVDDINRLICLKNISRPLKIIRFSQCNYGQVCDKLTMEATDLPTLHTWDGNICNHPWHPRSNEVGSSKELDRYPWEMMVIKAQAMLEIWKKPRASPDADSSCRKLTGRLPAAPGSSRCCLPGCRCQSGLIVGCASCGDVFHDEICFDSHTRICPGSLVEQIENDSGEPKPPRPWPGRPSKYLKHAGGCGTNTPQGATQQSTAGTKRPLAQPPQEEMAGSDLSKRIKAMPAAPLEVLSSVQNTPSASSLDALSGISHSASVDACGSTRSLAAAHPVRDRPIVATQRLGVGMRTEQTVRIGYKHRPLRDGGGKPSLGRYSPPRRRSSLSSIGGVIISMMHSYLPLFLDSLQPSDSKVHPFPEECMQAVRSAMGPSDLVGVEKGQPLHLRLLSHLAKQMKDPDWQFPLDVAQGVDLGVTEPTWPSPGIWPTKEEMRGEDWIEELPPELSVHDNYRSADLHNEDIEKTFEEERDIYGPGDGMVLGPFTPEQAAVICGCTASELIPGPMAAIEELDKIRTIFDGTKGGQNLWIRANTVEKTTAPTVHDALHALAWLQESRRWWELQASSEKDACGSPSYVILITSNSPEATWDASVDLRHSVYRDVASNPSWTPPSPEESWVLLKTDMSKAHRLIKVAQKDWKFQVASINGQWWVNKVGTYGMASAQLYWGRMAALLLRVLNHLFDAIDWQFVYVDDFAWLLRKSVHQPLSCAILATLAALGCPLAWHKTYVSSSNSWLGFSFDTVTPSLIMARSKHLLVIQGLRTLASGTAMQADEIASLLGRIQWATGCCPCTKAFLQPFWEWKQAVQVSGRPSKLLRLVSLMLIALFSQKHKYASPFSKASSWNGASDGSAKDACGSKAVGGWFCQGKPSSKQDVFWFYVPLNPERHKWAFTKSKASSAIAAIELFGNLCLLKGILTKARSAEVLGLFLEFATDNQGNSFSLLNEKTRKWPASPVLMEIFLQAHAAGCYLSPRHSMREQNTWADELCNGDVSSFDPSKEWVVDESNWILLDTLMEVASPSGGLGVLENTASP